MVIQFQILKTIERQVYFSMRLFNKNKNKDKGKDNRKNVFSGTFLAPEEFGKYCSLDGIYSQIGDFSQDYHEVAENMSVKELVKYHKEKQFWYDRGIISKQSCLGAVGFRVLKADVTPHVYAPVLEPTVQQQVRMMQNSDKTCMVLFCNLHNRQHKAGLVDVLYADTFEESIDYCKKWVIEQKNSGCFCYVIDKNLDKCFLISLKYQDCKEVDTDVILDYVIVRLMQYTFCIQTGVGSLAD